MSTKKHGFTIIEVVLVLAIAGLIFLMVFVALPALQRSQRDTQRRQDMARVVTALINYQANNGKLPMVGTDYPTASCSGKALNNMSSNPSAYVSNATNGICKFIATYLNASDATSNEFKDPDGTFYSMRISKDDAADTSPTNPEHMVDIRIGRKCGDSEGTVSSEGANNADFAILYKLEGAGTYCVDD